MNKLMARIFAVVMVVVMLGTVSFAADLGTDAITGVTAPTKEGYADQTTKTILAFATNTEEATAPAAGDVIIAIDQLSTGIPETIDIDDDKVAGKNFIAIVFSGTNGVKDYAYIDLREKDVKLQAVAVADTYTDANGVIYENIAKATFTATPEAGRTLVEYGIEFVQTAGEAGTFSGTPHRLGEEVTTAVNGEITFTAAIIGAPANAAFSATPYFIYE